MKCRGKIHPFNEGGDIMTYIVLRRSSFDNAMDELRFQQKCADRARKLKGEKRRVYLQKMHNQREHFWNVNVCMNV